MQRNMYFRGIPASANFITSNLFTLGVALLLLLHRPPLLPTPPPARGRQSDSPGILPSAHRWEEQADWLTPGAVGANPQATGCSLRFLSLSSLLSLYISPSTPQATLLLPTLCLQANALFMSDCHFLLLLLFLFFFLLSEVFFSPPL